MREQPRNHYRYLVEISRCKICSKPAVTKYGAARRSKRSRICGCLEATLRVLNTLGLFFSADQGCRRGSTICHNQRPEAEFVLTAVDRVASVSNFVITQIGRDSVGGVAGITMKRYSGIE